MKTKVIFVCFANVCRSTMAEFVFKNIMRRAGREEEFDISSAGILGETVGMDMPDGNKEVLERYGIPFEPRQARMLTREDYESADYVVCMDRSIKFAVTDMSGGDPGGKIRLFMSYMGVDEDAGSDCDVSDPHFTDNFDETYDVIIEGCREMAKVM